MKKIVGLLLAAAMTIGSFSCVSFAASANFESCGGWFESLYAEWPDTDPQNATVEYKAAGAASYTALEGEDKKYLQRVKDSDSARVDILGLAAGKYDIRVTSSTGATYEKKNVEVDEYDRSGYAHFNYSEGVGAYKDDGTLKPNAKVLYVTDSNKETVSVTSKDGTTVTGIGNILNSRGATNGTITNTNQGIIKKLATDGTPLVVRFIGEVNAPDGLTAYNSEDCGGTKGDNGYMARMMSGKDVTLEGVGYDAKIRGWGVHYICESSAPELGKSFEVRNLDFWGSPEDSIGMEGQQDSKKATANINAPVERCWVHNNTFEPQKIQEVFGIKPAESDKAEGDGCCDFKRGYYFTMDYNRFVNAHKTGLIGSAQYSLQYHITYHHNYYENCEARAPLARRADIHMYNNYFYRQSDFVISARASSYIFSEYNNYVECKRPQQLKAEGGTTGDIKSYNDTFLSCVEDMQGTIVSAKTDRISLAGDCKYKEFELDPNVSYIPGGDYKLDTSTVIAKENVFAYAGVMKEAPVAPEDTNISDIEESKIPAGAVSVPYEIATTKANTNLKQGMSGEFENIRYEIYKIADTGITINTKAVIFKLAQSADITVTDGGAKNASCELISQNGKVYLTGSGTVTIPEGVYFIQPNVLDIKTGKYKEAILAGLKFAAPTSEPERERDSKGDSEKSSDVSSEATTETTTEAPVVSVGEHKLNSGDISDSDLADAKSEDGYVTEDNVVIANVAAIDEEGITLKADSGITFIVKIDAKLIVELLNQYGINITGTTSTGQSTSRRITSADTESIKLSPGTYTISGASETDLAKIAGFLIESNVKNDFTKDGKVTATDAAMLYAEKHGGEPVDAEFKSEEVGDDYDKLLGIVRKNGF